MAHLHALNHMKYQHEQKTGQLERMVKYYAVRKPQS